MRLFRVGLGAVALTLWVGVMALSAEDAIPRHHRYPDGRTVAFTSWSMFLVCDSTWLQSEGKTDLVALYNAYLILVVTANENDAPLWAFPKTSGWRAEEIDPVWSKPYCESLGLSTHASPVVVITVHPPDTIKPSDAKVLLAFGQRRRRDIARMLTRLAERTAEERLGDARAGSAEWWSTWGRLSAWARSHLSGVTLSVQAENR